MIYFVTADRDKGKTTYLEKLVKQEPEAFGGILAIAGEGKNSYYARNVANNQTQLLMWQKNDQQNEQQNGSEPQGVYIGKFLCDQKVFDWANEVLRSTQKPKVVIDEVGRLELRDEGFAPTLRALDNKKTYYLAVRKQFLQEVISHFGFENYQVIEVYASSSSN